MHGYGYDQVQAERDYPEEATMKAEPASHVSSSFHQIEVEGEHLLEAIRELDLRLSDVLRPEADASPKSAGEPRPPLVPLAERLTSHSGTVRMARQYIVSILERLEL